MKAHQLIKITMNCEKFGYKENKQMFIKWLKKILPAIATKRNSIMEEIPLKAINQVSAFCLN